MLVECTHYKVLVSDATFTRDVVVEGPVGSEIDGVFKLFDDV